MADNTNWTLNLPPLAGYRPVGIIVDLPPGAYKGIITSTSMEPAKTAGKQPAVLVKLKITEGDQKGQQLNIYVQTDFSKEFNCRHWMTLLLSTGLVADPSQLANGAQIAHGNLVNREAYAHLSIRKTAVEKGDDEDVEDGGKQKTQYNKVFVTREAYQTAVESAVAGAAPTGAAPWQPAQPAAPIAAPSYGALAPTAPAPQPPQMTPHGAPFAPTPFANGAPPAPSGMQSLQSAFGAPPQS